MSAPSRVPRAVAPVLALLASACGVSGTLAASSGGGGGGGGSTPPPSPVVRVTSPTAGETISGFVTFTYDARDPSGGSGGRSLVSVTPQFRVPPGSRFEDPPWFDMTEASGTGSEGTAGLRLGEHTFVWNTLADPIARTDLSVLDIEIRVLAEWERGGRDRRRFHSPARRFRLETRLTTTYFPRSDTAAALHAEIVDVAVDANGDALVGTAVVNSVDRIDSNGRVARVLGFGLPGTVTEDGHHPGSVRLPRLAAFAVDASGSIFSVHGDRLLVTNLAAEPLVFGRADGADADTDADTVVVAPQSVSTILVPGMSDASCIRLHPSGALLVVNRLEDGSSELLAIHFADPDEPASAPIELAGVTLQPGTTARVAGGGTGTADGAGGLATRIENAASVAVGPSGEIYWSETGRGVVRVLNPTAAPLLVAGRLVEPGAVDTVAGDVGGTGSARNTRLRAPLGITVSGSGLLFVAEATGLEVQVINVGEVPQSFNEIVDLAPGELDLAAGSGSLSPPSRSRYVALHGPTAVAFSPSGLLLVADGDRVIAANGTDDTVAGFGRILGLYLTETLYTVEGRGGVPFESPRAVQVGSPDLAGGSTVFVTDRTTVRVMNLAPEPLSVAGSTVGAGELAILAGGAVQAFAGDGGPVGDAAFDTPSALVADGPERLYVADTGNDRIRVLHLGDPATAGSFIVAGKTVDPATVATVVGGADGPVPEDGDGLPLGECSLSGPLGLCIAPSGALLVADTGHHRVRAVNLTDEEMTVGGVVLPPATVMTLIGTGSRGWSADGPGPWAIDTPTALAVDRNLVYFAEAGSARIRVLNTSDVVVAVAGVEVAPLEIATIVGTGVRGNAGDGGRAIDAEIDSPRSLFVATESGTGRALLFADGPQHVIRAVNLTDDRAVVLRVSDENGYARTLAATTLFTLAGGPNSFGRPNAPGFAGDGSFAQDARFAEPWGVAISLRSGSCLGPIIVADQDNDRIRALGSIPIRSCTEVP